jgi:hypothetical protein
MSRVILSVPFGGKSSLSLTYGLFRTRQFTISNTRESDMKAHVSISTNAGSSSCVFSWDPKDKFIDLNHNCHGWFFSSPRRWLVDSSHINNRESQDILDIYFPMAEMDKTVYLTMNKNSGELSVSVSAINMEKYVAPSQSTKEVVYMAAAALLYLIFVL